MSQSKTHLLNCPHCKAMLEVDAGSGKVVGSWEGARADRPTKERFSEALQKLDEGKKKRDEFFSSAAERLKEKKKKTDQLFGDSLKKIKEEGLEGPPERPFDFD